MVSMSVMSWLGSYLAPLLASFVVLGVVMEVLDRYWGVRFYRWYYNRGVKPEDRMPAGKEIGFFYGRSLRVRNNRAIAASAVQSGLALAFGSYSSWEMIAEIPALFLEAWFLLPGLWLGDKLYGVLQKQDQIFHAIEHREETAKELMSNVGSTLTRVKDAALSAIPVPAAKEATPEPKEPPRSMSAADILQRQADGRKL